MEIFLPTSLKGEKLRRFKNMVVNCWKVGSEDTDKIGNYNYILQKHFEIIFHV